MAEDFRLAGIVKEGVWLVVAYQRTERGWILHGAVGDRQRSTFDVPYRPIKWRKALKDRGWKIVWRRKIDPDENKVHDDLLGAFGMRRLRHMSADEAAEQAVADVQAARKRAKRQANRLK